MKKIAISSLLLLTCLLAQSQALENESDSTSKPKIRITNFEFGINATAGGDGKDGGIGVGFYFEPKFIRKNKSELGLLMGYNQFNQIYFDAPDYKHRDHHVGTLFVTVKQSGKKFLGLYGGIGAGLVLAKVGGRFDFYNGQSDTSDSFILRPGVLWDVGLHLGPLNLGLKLIFGSYFMGGLNIGIKL